MADEESRKKSGKDSKDKVPVSQSTAARGEGTPPSLSSSARQGSGDDGKQSHRKSAKGKRAADNPTLNLPPATGGDSSQRSQRSQRSPRSQRSQRGLKMAATTSQRVSKKKAKAPKGQALSKLVEGEESEGDSTQTSKGADVQELGRDLPQLSPAMKMLSELDKRLIHILAAGAIRLICVAWLRQQHPDFRMPSRQALEQLERQGASPSPLLAPAEAVRLVLRCQRLVGVLSYGWLSPGEPDPDGDRIGIVRAALDANDYIEALFWDFACARSRFEA